MKSVLAGSKADVIAALDVGTSRVCCAIAQPDGAGDARLLGIGETASHGIRAGNVVDMAAAEMAVRNAVDAAERMAKVTLDRVVVSLSGGTPQSTPVAVEVPVSGRTVTDGDLRRAAASHTIGDRLTPEREAGREIVQTIATGYAIDGCRGIRDPRGMHGRELGMTMHVVTAASGPLRNLRQCVERCHLDVEAVVVAPYATGLGTLVDEEAELGATVIDMGGGTTSVAVFSEGEAVFADVIPLGGQHVTNDIARGLSTSRANAERMKTLYGDATTGARDTREILEVPQVGEETEGAAQRIPRSLLTGIIQPRLEETFELVRERLESHGVDRVAGRRAVLAGGACQMPGTRELAETVLGKQVRIGTPADTAGLGRTTNGPGYAVSAGMLTYALAADPAGLPRGDLRAPSGVLGRLGTWLREYL